MRRRLESRFAPGSCGSSKRPSSAESSSFGSLKGDPVDDRLDSSPRPRPRGRWTPPGATLSVVSSPSRSEPPAAETELELPSRPRPRPLPALENARIAHDAHEHLDAPTQQGVRCILVYSWTTIVTYYRSLSLDNSKDISISETVSINLLSQRCAARVLCARPEPRPARGDGRSALVAPDVAAWTSATPWRTCTGSRSTACHSALC